MPQTTTAFGACDMSIWLDNSAGVLVDISGSSSTLGVDFQNLLGMFRTFGSRWPVRMECPKDASFSFTAVYSSAAAEAAQCLLGWFFIIPSGRRTFTFYAPAKNVGADKYSCEVRLSDLSWTGDPGKADPIIITAKLAPDGAVTRVTNAT
jgi:hypothetical protein